MKMKDLQKMMKQAQEMQEKMAREMAETVVEASVGGGQVTVRMNGGKMLISVHINPEVLDPEDPDLVEDLVLAAVNSAVGKVDDLMGKQLSGMKALF